jgi:glycosyltransferase involved in cell wall biosynthesis
MSEDSQQAARFEPRVMPREVGQPLVSAIVPTHNRAALVVRAVQSIMAQTYRNLEIIVVDDASTDDTRTAIERLGDTRIRYVRHDTNKGGSAARNTGIRHARGTYIAFLDDDDEWEPRKTEEQVAALQHHDVVLCTSASEHAGAMELGFGETITLEELRHGRCTAGGTAVLMAKADVLEETMFDESLPRYQDWDLFIRIGLKHEIAYLNKPLVRYNEGAHGRITNSILGLPAAKMEQQFRMLGKHRQFFGEKWFRRHMARSLLYGIKYRQDKLRHLAYTAHRYGAMNVVRAMLARFSARLRSAN